MVQILLLVGVALASIVGLGAPVPPTQAFDGTLKIRRGTRGGTAKKSAELANPRRPGLFVDPQRCPFCNFNMEYIRPAALYGHVLKKHPNVALCTMWPEREPEKVPPAASRPRRPRIHVVGYDKQSVLSATKLADKFPNAACLVPSQIVAEPFDRPARPPQSAAQRAQCAARRAARLAVRRRVCLRPVPRPIFSDIGGPYMQHEGVGPDAAVQQLVLDHAGPHLATNHATSQNEVGRLNFPLVENPHLDLNELPAISSPWDSDPLCHWDEIVPETHYGPRENTRS